MCHVKKNKQIDVVPNKLNLPKQLSFKHFGNEINISDGLPLLPRFYFCDESDH